ncbi:hypothetical protein BHE74_00043881 [Ensete ventricosum]|nr:hypothetical protein BHE74_00043881 [Ensete ventricosum]
METAEGQIRGILTHGGRYVRYNVYGNLFEVTAKYVPPLRPLGRGAYGIVIGVKDIIRPPQRENFSDVYIVYELMDTDLNQIIRSKQPLTDDHCQVSF